MHRVLSRCGGCGRKAAAARKSSSLVKRTDYAEAGTTEDWIVNPVDKSISVLKLADGQYVDYGIFRRGEQAASHLLAGFAVGVDEVFDAQ